MTDFRHLSRRDLLAYLGRGLAIMPILGTTGCTSCGGGSSSTTPPVPGITEQQLLDDIASSSFRFFWNEAPANTGMVKDRALADGNDTRTVSSVASTGFGLTALCIADQRQLLPTEQIKARVTATLTFILNNLAQQNGFFYHFVDMNSGVRAFNSEVSTIDTSLLLCGVLTARQYFNDPTITNLANQIYNRVDWPWFLNGGTAFSMGWTPESGFLASRWDTYCELMMIYLLAIGSNTYPVPASAWDAFSRPTLTFQGTTYITTTAPLFIHQFSHAWFDFRNKKDAYANYFDNSVKATQAHKAFCLSLNNSFSDYTDNLWGITSSDSSGGYVAWGGPPSMGPIDGTVVPCATGGSLPFVSSDCLKVLRYIRDHYPSAWHKYGFTDAFNPLKNWYNPDVIGIDVGITMLMAENYRTQFVWQTFMKNPEVISAMNKVGFRQV
jgi:hypothetical protein